MGWSVWLIWLGLWQMASAPADCSFELKTFLSNPAEVVSVSEELQASRLQTVACDRSV